MTKKIINSEEYKKLVSARNKIIWPLTAIMMAAYYTFVLIIAFAPSFFAQQIGESQITLGIYAGLGLIVFTFCLTGVYVYYANKKIEPLLLDIHEKFGD